MTAHTAAVTTTDLVRQSIEGKKFSPFNALVAFALLFTLLSSVVILVTLLADTVTAALPVFASRGFGFITSSLSPTAASAGIWQAIMGSLALTGFVIAVAFPFGVAAAVYLEEYAPDNRLTRFINSNIRNLAGVPSIVYGILGLFLFVEILMRGVFGASEGIAGRNVVAGGLTLAVLVLPIMIITTSEALRAVPGGLREASLAVERRVGNDQASSVAGCHPGHPHRNGAHHRPCLRRICAPVVGGAQLSLFFSVSSDASFADLMLNQPYTALPIVVFNFARQPQAEFVALTAASIVVLLVMLLTVNAAAVIARDRYERRYR